jgi:hypothetical protein
MEEGGAALLGGLGRVGIAVCAPAAPRDPRQFGVEAPAVPAQPQEAGEHFQIRPFAQRLDAFVSLVRLPAVLAALRHDQPSNGAPSAPADSGQFAAEPQLSQPGRANRANISRYGPSHNAPIPSQTSSSLQLRRFCLLIGDRFLHALFLSLKYRQ